jgi:hypothetical protein
MPDRIALKRLVPADLVIFESLFRTATVGGNQKAITLNRTVFIDRLYPGLPAAAASTAGNDLAVPVTLTILGPAAATPHVVPLNITKGRKEKPYKNWRLNGKFIRDPEGEPGRFGILVPGDLAVMEFVGEPAPQQVTLLLITAGAPADAPLHASLNPLIPGGRRTMVEITREKIAEAASAVPAAHPIWAVAGNPQLSAALEDAAQGGVRGVDVLSKRMARTVTAAALAAAKMAAEKNGRDGEALAWRQLQRMKDLGAWSSIEWTSQTNPVSPFDFRAIEGSGTVVRIDAKSTSGEFERIVHMSIAELVAASDGTRYDLWRVYRLNEDGAKMRAASDIGALAKSILGGLKLPPGITADSVSIDPAALT